MLHCRGRLLVRLLLGRGSCSLCKKSRLKLVEGDGVGLHPCILIPFLCNQLGEEVRTLLVTAAELPEMKLKWPTAGSPLWKW